MQDEVESMVQRIGTTGGAVLFSTICLRINACGLANSPLDREKWLSALGIRLRPPRVE